MNRLGIGSARVLIVLCAVLATSCSSGTSSRPAQQASAPSQPPTQAATQPPPASSQPAQLATAPSQPAQQATPANVIATGQYSADPDLRCDLLQVKRVSGGALLVQWRIVNTAGGQAPGGLTASQPKSINYDGHWVDLYFIDPAENKKYAFLTDAAGSNIADVFWGNLPAGQQHGSWAKFPAPPVTSTRIAVHIPSFPPFEDVPLSQ
jgi:hypothetical protein